MESATPGSDMELTVTISTGTQPVPAAANPYAYIAIRGLADGTPEPQDGAPALDWYTGDDTSTTWRLPLADILKTDAAGNYAPGQAVPLKYRASFYDNLHPNLTAGGTDPAALDLPDIPDTLDFDTYEPVR